MSLSHLARMAENRDGFIAGTLAAYQRVHGLDDHGIAELLHCSVEDVTHVKLCKLPRLDLYDQDIAHIAEHVHADPVALGQLLDSKNVRP